MSVIAIASVAPLNGDGPRAAGPEPSVEVRMREPSCSITAFTSPFLSEVRALFDGRPVPTAVEVRDALELVYGDRVAQTIAEYEYVWVCVNGFWLLRCIEISQFEIALGAERAIVVRVREPMPVS